MFVQNIVTIMNCKRFREKLWWKSNKKTVGVKLPTFILT